MKSKIISALMIATIVLGFAAIFPTALSTPSGGQLYVDPASNVFTELYLGQMFTVNVTIANTTEFMGVSYHFTWDPTLLECQSMTEILYHQLTPPAKYANIWNLAFAFDNVGGFADYAQLYQNGGQALADGYAPLNVTTGIATAMYVFKVIQEPTLLNTPVSCAFTISGENIGDKDANPLSMTVINGLYQNNWAPPPNKPYFDVVPATYTASNVGQVFNISVRVNQLSAGWSAVGFEFKLSYNATILQLLNVYEGPWLPPFGAPPNQGTLFMTFFGAGFVQVGDVELPAINGSWVPPLPSAGVPGGVMAILEFNATMQGMFPLVLSCPLHLYATIVGDINGNQVLQDPSVDGFYSITPKVLGRAIDVFVGQDGIPYPFPYGGQGPMAPADMFWPQKQVCVWAYVTYNEWPEQQKDVAFEIFDPHGTRWGIIYARTNETGYAYTCFRLPWPCDNPEYYIGVWTVVGTVDVACQIINDTVTFHYDYLVRIWKVTADKASYKHNETACYTIEYGSHAQQYYNVTIAITGLDESGVPFGFAFKQVEIGGTVFCQYKNYTDTLCIYIPKWARAGQGEVDAAILDNWPSLGGTVQSGYWTGTQWLGYAPTPITIEAAWA